MSAATMQSTVSTQMGFGVPGDQYSDAPWRAQPFRVNDAATNVVGYMFTLVSAGLARCGGTGLLAGILVNSKEYVLRGDGTNPLNPSLEVAANSQVDLVQEGEIVIALGADANVGDIVLYDTTTGALSAVAPTTAHLPAGTANAYGQITRFIANAGGAQLAVAYFNIPQAATIPA